MSPLMNFFRLEEIEAIAKLKKTTITDREAAIILGVSIPDICLLTKAGTLKHAFGSDDNYTGYYRYHRRDVAKVQSRLAII